VFYTSEEHKAKKRARSKIPEVKAKRNETDRIKKTTNPNFRLAANLRGRLGSAVKNNSKSGSAVSDLGCTIEFLKQHLSSKFQPGMSWNNWGNGFGKWNIDHIIPLAAFDLTDRQHVVLACHYFNLQPLWYEQNMSKQDKY
jgi:hypothetical protein